MSDDEMPSSYCLLGLEPSEKPQEFGLYGEHMENSTALHRKLQSKMEALRILRGELQQFRTERDQFKLMAETLQLRYSSIKRCSDFNGICGNTNVANLLHETRERNIKLTTEVEALKQKLNEMQGDIELLRSQRKTHVGGKAESKHIIAINDSDSHKEEIQWRLERVRFICHLENLKKKNAQLVYDIKTIIDEKEELITERDAYKCKTHRLNHELLVALKANKMHPRFLDIDSLLLENKYLLERIKNFENELDLTKQSMNKYKTMLEAKRKKSVLKLGTQVNNESILSHKQVKTLLENGIDLPTKTETIQDLKSLCLTLLDNLNDKNLALSHQKKTNKMLATKIAELEQRIQALACTADTDVSSSCINGYAPSQLLLNGYCSSIVDSNGTLETTTTTTATSETLKQSNHHTGDREALSSPEDEKTHKTSRGVISDDGMSSMSTESGRSILSSEYDNLGPSCSLSEFTRSALGTYQTPSTTTDSSRRVVNGITLVPPAVARQRAEDLKDLPTELAELVQKALHELDMRDFDEVVAEDVATEAEHRIEATAEMKENEQTIH